MNKSYAGQSFKSQYNRGGPKPQFNVQNVGQFKQDIETITSKKIIAKVLLKAMTDAKPASHFKTKLEAAVNLRLKSTEAVLEVLRRNKNAFNNIYQSFYFNIKFKYDKEREKITMTISDEEPIDIDSVKTIREAEGACNSFLKVIVDPAKKQWDEENNPKLKEIQDLLDDEFRTPPKSQKIKSSLSQEWDLAEPHQEGIELAELIKDSSMRTPEKIKSPEENPLVAKFADQLPEGLSKASKAVHAENLQVLENHNL